MKKRILLIFSFMLLTFLLVGCGTKIYEVSFLMNGGNEENYTIELSELSLIEIPNKPTKEGYLFDYWQEQETERKWNFATDKVTKNITLIAKWKLPEVETFTVRFFTLDGKPVPVEQIVEINEKVIKPVDPIRDDYKFLGWFLPDDTKPYDFNQEVTEDLIISARWEKINYVTIKFILDEGMPEIDDLIVPQGEKIVKPRDPLKEGYTFIGWYLNDVLFDFKEAINEDITLKARFEKDIIYYFVNFFDDDEIIHTFEIIDGNKVDKPADPEKEGYSFIGWYIGDDKFDFNTLVKTDLNITAKWQEELTINFYLDSEKEVLYKTFKVLKGETLEKPTDPIKENNIFKGWFDGDTEFSFLTEISSNLDLVASWQKEYVVKFYLDDEALEVYLKELVPEGELLTKPTDPEKDFYIFLGWYLNGEEFNFENPITDDLTIIGLWEEEPFVAKAFINDEEYQSINEAALNASIGDTILIAGGIHDIDIDVNVNNLTFKHKDDEEEAIITSKISLKVGLNGVTFDGLSFTDNATIHSPGKIDNFVFINNKVYDSTLIPSEYYPKNRIDVNAFIRLYASGGENIVGNVTIKDNEFSNIKADVISLARTSVGSSMILKDNTFNNIVNSAIRFDGGYNNGTYKITHNTFTNDIDLENLAVIVFRAYSSSSGNVQIIDIKDNIFVNMGSTKVDISDTHPGSGVITFSTYNESETIITIVDNIFTNTSNTIHFRDKRNKHQKLSFTAENNIFNDGDGYIFYESNYLVSDSNIKFQGNTYYINDVLVDLSVVSDRIIRIEEEM